MSTIITEQVYIETARCERSEPDFIIVLLVCSLYKIQLHIASKLNNNYKNVYKKLH